MGGAREREVLEERERRGLLRLRPHQRLRRRLDGVRLEDGGARARVQRQVDEGRARVGVERGVVDEELGAAARRRGARQRDVGVRRAWRRGAAALPKACMSVTSSRVPRAEYCRSHPSAASRTSTCTAELVLFSLSSAIRRLFERRRRPGARQRLLLRRPSPLEVIAGCVWPCWSRCHCSMMAGRAPAAPAAPALPAAAA